MLEIQMDALQTRIQAHLDSLVLAGKERGVQVAVYHQGQLVVDAWAGTTDANDGVAVDGDTLFPVFSVTKSWASTLAHLVVERGLIEYDTPVADVWPGFEAKGKGAITFRHLLSHSAGLMYIPEGVVVEDFADWDRMCDALAAQSPAFEPGSRAEYHAITYGWLVGEVLRRVDGRGFPQMLREEITEPLGDLSLYCGLPGGIQQPVAVLDEPNAVAPEDDGKPSAIPAWVQPLDAYMNLEVAHGTCLPATTGIANARSLARHMAALLPGGVDGVALLPPSRIRVATEDQDLLNSNGDPAKHGLGYVRYVDYSRPGSLQVAFGHGGYGGAISWGDPERGLAVGLTKNLLSQNDTQAELYHLLDEVF